MYVSSSGPATAAPVLLLHGGGVAGWMWDSLRHQLETGHRVLVPDLPGHGRSAGEPYLSHSATVGALAEVLTAAARHRPTTVIGLSLGAQLAIQLAAGHPDLVDRVVVVSAQAKAMPLTGLTLAALGVTAPLARQRWFATLQARELRIPAHLLEDYLRTSAGLTRQTLVAAVGDNLRFALPAEWSRFGGRALVMAGREEPRLMRDSAAIIHAALPGSELEIVERCGHGIPLQRPEWFNARITAWLDAA